MSRNPKELTVVEPRRHFNIHLLAELVTHRELLYFFVWRDIKVRYRQTVLGLFWVVLQPLLMMGLYSVIFGSIVKLPQGAHPYSLFVVTGIIPWTFLSGSLSDAGNSLLANTHLIGKIYFPRLYLPAARILVLLVDFSAATTLLCLVSLVLNPQIVASLAMLPVAMAFCVTLAFGAGALLSALNVKYRDVNYIIPFALQIWMFSTPIIYPVEVIPAKFRWIVDLNPMTGIVELFRAALLGGAIQPSVLLYSGGTSLAILLIGVYCFERVQHKFADIM